MAFTAISSSMPSSASVRSILSSQCISTPTTPQKSSSLSWASSFPSISLSRGSPFVSSNPAHAKVLFIQSAWTRRSRGEAAKRPNKKSWKQRTDMYMRPFLLNVFFSKKFIHAKVMHRGTSKVISVATTNAKDLRNSLPSLTDHNACRVIGKLIAERSKEADVYAMSYEPRKDERIEVWTTGFEGPTKDEGKGKGNGSSWCRTFHSPARTFRTWPVYASQPPNNRQRPPPGVDTRIHWQNDEEGWIGGPTPSQSRRDQKEQNNNALGPSFADLLNNSSDSHYQFLGVGAEADLEEIKSAYRRLSKEYHPDTTSLPLKAASDKFMKLKQVYEVLSNEESRKFYDWTLAQEEASRQADKLRIKLEDPYEQELQNWKSTPDMVDRLAGRNMDLSDQATTALTLDILIILFAIGCIVYVLLFKEPYY